MRPNRSAQGPMELRSWAKYDLGCRGKNFLMESKNEWRFLKLWTDGEVFDGPRWMYLIERFRDVRCTKWVTGNQRCTCSGEEMG